MSTPSELEGHDAPRLFDDDGVVAPRARHSDPETSHAAAAAVARTASALEAEILAAFAVAGARGLTDDELCSRLPVRYWPTVKSARSRLSKAGRLEDTDGRRATARGRAAIVRVVVD